METRISMPTLISGIRFGDMIDFLVSLELHEDSATMEIACQNSLINADKRMTTRSYKIPLTIESSAADLKSNCQHQFVEYSLANRDDSKNYIINRQNLECNLINNVFM